jgi:hypothetical protein
VNAPTFTEITDLADPWLPDEFRTLEQHITKYDPYSALRPERLLAEASERTGLADFGSDWFRTPLEVLCHSLLTEGNLSPLGALSQRMQLVRLLCARLRVEQLIADHPEINDQPQDSPIVIAGLPRSGTTFLHGLLNVDPTLRALSDEESEGPPEPGTDGADGGPVSDAFTRALTEGIPLMERMIEVSENSAKEEIRLLALSISSVLFETQVPLPGYRDWCLANDQTPAYEYLARVLRVLRCQRGGGPWALKTMQHVEQLPALSAAFPTATIVCTHRDPAAVIPSISTMLAYGQRLTTKSVDPVYTAKYWTDRILGMTDRCLSDHDRLGSSRMIDVTMARIRDDPDGVVGEIYATAGIPLTAAAKQAMDELRQRRHPHRHGRIRYNPASLGLDLNEIRERSAAYRARFAVPIEG